MEKETYDKLSAPLSKDAIQRSQGAKTGKGYDTTGYGYQFIVNRFNEVLGIGGWNWGFEEITRAVGKYKSGQPFYSITGKATIQIKDNDKDIAHSEYGGHQSSSLTDALKGASTNAFKKTAAFFGVGKQAFEKTIDEDNLPSVEKIGKPVVKPVFKIISEIKLAKKADLPKWKDFVEKSPYNQTQKNVMLRVIEEKEK